MGRTRNPAIAEDAAELRCQARRYAGKPQQKRLLFLAFLKENPTCSIAEGAEAAGLSARQGRYLWEDYRAGGLERVLARRSWKSRKPEALPDVVVSSPEERVAGMTATDLLNFMNAMARLREIDDVYKWGARLKEILIEFIPEVDYAVVSISHNVGPNLKLYFTLHQHRFPDGRFVPIVETVPNITSSNNYKLIAEHGKQNGFPFSNYHSLLTGFDLHTSSIPEWGNHAYIGSIILFRHISEPQFSPDFLAFVEELQPILILAFTEFILRLARLNPAITIFFNAINTVAENANLSHREQDVLYLLLLGNTYEEIAELLTIAPATVSKHVRSIYKKAGVRRLSEFFARYFTPRDHFPEKEKKGE